MTDQIFYDSTPAENYCRPWRCASTDAAVATARALCRDTAYDAYACNESPSASGHVRVWVGLRDNRDGAAHSARIQTVASAFRAAGFRVRAIRDGRRVIALRLTDREAKYYRKAV